MRCLGVLAFWLVAALASGDFTDKVPLTIKAVQRGPTGLSAARDTIFALATLDKYIFAEKEPNSDGILEVQVPPGRYILSAVYAAKPLNIEVRAPSTFITVLVSPKGDTLSVLPPPRPNKREDGGMTPSLWIGLVFVGAIVVFLMFTSFAHLNQQADKNLRFLMALCAGLAASFFTGDALFRYQSNLGSGTNIFLSGTAGFALFLVVWITYAKSPQQAPPNPLPNGGVKLSLPANWSFEQAARAIAAAAQRSILFDNFDEAQLATKLPETQIDAPTVRDALEQLRHNSSLPAYRVTFDKGVYHVQRS